MAGVYVQYGCGLCAPDGWLNFDASPVLRLQRLPLLGRVGTCIKPVFPAPVRFGDITRGLDVADASCDGVYCSHVLEHLSLDACRQALVNSLRMLRPGARFRLVLPDLRILAERYVQSADASAGLRFMEASGLGLKQRPRGLIGLLRKTLGNSSHLWLWDFPSLAEELRSAGFTEIRRAVRGDSGDPMFDRVEDPARWTDAVAVDCRRPA